MLAEQLEFVKNLQLIREPWLDYLIKQCNWFDRQEFTFVLIPLIWFGWGWRAGLKLFYLMSFAHLVNIGLKEAFASPRPFHLDPSLGLIHVGGYGFPSGAAQTAILLSGLLILTLQNKWKWPLAIFYTALISFSRLYLGVHFPMDIVGGWIAGLALLGLYWIVMPPLEQFFHKRTPFQSLLIPLVLLCLLVIIWPEPVTISIAGCGIGLSLGIYATESFCFSFPSSKLIRCLQVLIGSAGIFGIHWVMQNKLPASLPTIFFQMLLIGLWMSLCVPCLVKEKSA